MTATQAQAANRQSKPTGARGGDRSPHRARARARALHPLAVRRRPPRVDHRRDRRAHRAAAHDRLPHGPHARGGRVPGARHDDQPLPPRPGGHHDGLRRRGQFRVRRARAPVPRGAPGARANRSRWRSPSTACPCAWASSTPPGRSSARSRRAASSATWPPCTARSSPRSRPPSERAALLAQKRRQHTPRTVTDPEALERELERVAQRGRGLRRRGAATSASAPSARPCATSWATSWPRVSVVMPTGRFGPEERDLCTRAVKDAAASLSAYLGWNPSRPSPGSNRLTPAWRALHLWRKDSD